MSEISPIRISSLQGDYDVVFLRNLDEVLSKLTLDERSLAVVDEGVARLYPRFISAIEKEIPVFRVEPNEETKSLAGVERLARWLVEKKAIKSTKMVAVGGGCIQDLVSFTSHIYFRGIDWEFVPTTILSQADSAIGAKSGINLLPYKNQFGAMHSPKAIYIDTTFLETLPDVEIMSGYGEIAKLSVTSSKHFLDLLEASLEHGGLRNVRLLELIRASLIAKKEIIELDEYESDLRRVLNYGHSFGHALEALTNHQIPHGVAVLWGIDAVNFIGERIGITAHQVARRMRSIISAHFDFALNEIPSAEDLLSMIKRDKKMKDGKMNFVFLREIGDFVIRPTEVDDALLAHVRDFLASDYVFRRD